ncbi:MAG: hypothetical protein MOB07_23145 [Acidobacteria bacterium]|nr:hypothetical protein [Acidobacteriota bacterium]
MFLRHYKLVGHTPVPCRSVLEWAVWFETADLRVAFDEVNGVEVSTIFLGLDHSGGLGTPILFETMVFGGPRDGAQCRYRTWDHAMAGHAQIVADVLAHEEWPAELGV